MKLQMGKKKRNMDTKIKICQRFIRVSNSHQNNKHKPSKSLAIITLQNELSFQSFL